MPKGGKREGAGRKPKAPSDKAKRILVSLPPELYRLIKEHGKPTELIQKLLTEYFERTSTNDTQD